MAANPNPSAPVLSRGRHHWPSRRVCLMEYTAELAGGPRSDSPECTDPVLATVARAVNDYSSDAGRQRLVALAPALAASRRADDTRYDIARRCVLTALPYAVGTRRFVLTAAVLGVDRADAGALTLDSEWALLNDAESVAAATDLSDGSRIGRREHARRGMPLAIEAAVAVIAKEAPDADEVLYRLLVQCLDDRNGAAGHRPTLAHRPVPVG
jgi:hypothetical protein